MFINFKIYWKLFFKSTLISMFIAFLSFFVIVTIPIVISIYKKSIEKDLAVKQPHLYLVFKNDNQQLSKQNMKLLREKIIKVDKIKNILTINGYIKDTITLRLFSHRNIQSSFVEGKVEVIGLYDEFPSSYDFLRFSYLNMGFDDTILTYKEFIKRFIDRKSIAIINNSLHSQFSSPLSSATKVNAIYFKNGKKVTSISLLIGGVMQDYNPSSVMLLKYKMAIKLLDKAPDSVTGFAINVKDLEQLATTKKLLKKAFKDKFIVQTWLDKNIQQREIFKIFTFVSYVVECSIFVLSLLVILFLFYKNILSKQPQMRILYTLGVYLKKQFLFFSLLFLSVGVFGGVVFAIKIVPYLVTFLGLEVERVSFGMFEYQLFISYFVFVLSIKFLSDKILEQDFKIY